MSLGTQIGQEVKAALETVRPALQEMSGGAVVPVVVVVVISGQVKIERELEFGT